MISVDLNSDLGKASAILKLAMMKNCFAVFLQPTLLVDFMPATIMS